MKTPGTPFTFVASLCLLLVGASSLAAQMTPSAPLPGDTTIAPLFGAQFDPRVAAGNGEYFAVWYDERTMIETTVEGDPWEVRQSDIFGMRLGPDGTPIDSMPIRVDGSSYSQVSPDVAGNGMDWLVAYESRSVSSTGYYTTQDVRAVRVSASGEVLDATPIEIDVSDNEAYVHCVASDGSNWGVFRTDAFTMYGRVIGADGSVGPTIDVVPAGSWKFDPAVAFANDRYLLVWEGSGLRGQLLDVNLAPIGGSFSIPISGLDAEVATDGTDFYVTAANLGSWSEIRGSVVRSDGTVVTPGGTLLDGQSYLALEPAQAAWDGSGYVMTWTEWRYIFPQGPEETLKFNRVDSNGVLQFAEPQTVIQSTDFSVRRPIVASLGAGGTYAAWLDNRNSSKFQYDGYATIIDSAGGTTAEQSYTVGPPAQIAPDLVSGPTGATLEQDVNLAIFISADSAETRVVFQRLDGTGAALDPEPVVLAGGTDRYANPGAAWNGTEWLVVWEDIYGGAGTGLGTGGVLAKRVLPDGTVLDALPIDVITGNGPDVGALSVVDGAFLVVATTLTSGDIRTLYGMRVGADGNLLDGSKTWLGFDYAQSPAVEGFDDRWLVVWHKRPTHDTPSSQLHARFMLADGTPLAEFDPSSSTTDEMDPDIVIVGDLATVAWGDGADVRVRQIMKDGTTLGDPAGVVVSAAENEQSTPTIVADGAKFTVTWVDDRIHGIFEPGVGDLFGARLDSALTVLEPLGVPLLADPKSPEGEAGLAGHMGVSTLLAPAILPEFGNWRVSVGTWRDWDSMGGNVPGTGGVPRLWMSGLLSPGEMVSTDISNALPGTIGSFVVGTTELSVPFKGGTMVPFPSLLLPIATDPLGAASFAVLTPETLPSGLDFYVQAWLVDAGASAGYSATDGFHGSTP